MLDNNIAVVDLLLKSGAKSNLDNALTKAKKNGYLEIIELLKLAGAKE